MEAVTLAVNDMAPLAQVFPQMFDWLDPDQLPKHIFDVRGVPAKVTRSEEQVEALRAARQEQQAKEQSMVEGAQIAESMGKAAPMVKVLQGGKGAAA